MIPSYKVLLVSIFHELSKKRGKRISWMYEKKNMMDLKSNILHGIKSIRSMKFESRYLQKQLAIIYPLLLKHYIALKVNVIRRSASGYV